MVTQASSATICSRTPDPNMVLSITAYGHPSTWSCMATWVVMDNDMSHSCHRTIDPNMAPAAAQSTDTRMTSVVTWATDTGAGPWTQLCYSLIPQPPSPSPTTLQQQGPQTSWPQVEVQAMHINMASGGSSGLGMEMVQPVSSAYSLLHSSIFLTPPSKIHSSQWH